MSEDVIARAEQWLAEAAEARAQCDAEVSECWACAWNDRGVAIIRDLLARVRQEPVCALCDPANLRPGDIEALLSLLDKEPPR